MRYKLKKDLPFDCIGSPVTIITHDDGESHSMIRCDNSKREYAIPMLHLYDWIKEVKPREWFIMMDKDDNVIASLTAQQYGDRYIKRNCPIQFVTKVVKVREVLE